MKWMKRLRLINWHYFKDVTMDFGKQTLVTGQNAAGKSTIIDALQVLFVADHRLVRFNAAAHDEAKRSYLNYLKGKIGSDERSFVREGDFTTYIVSEFRDEDKKESFLIGVAVDVFRDRSYEEEYFILADTRLDELDLVNIKGDLLNREEFRRRYGGSSLGVGRGGSRRQAIFERNKTNYQKAMLARLGQVPERFFRIFTKALSFKPIQNIRDFVEDYILDKRELQLDLMKQNFELHERYKLELERLLEKKLQLQGIREAYGNYARLTETVKEQDYVIRRLRVQYESENVEQKEREKERAGEQLDQIRQDIELAEMKRAEAHEEGLKAYQKWQSDSAEVRKRELEVRIEELRQQQKELDRLWRIYESQLQEEVSLLARYAEGGPDNEFWSPGPEDREQLEKTTLVLNELLGRVHNGQVDLYEEEEWGARLQAAGVAVSGQHQRLIIGEARLKESLQELERRITETERIIRDLEQKRRSYSEPVRQLKELLEEGLKGRSPVWVFCEEAELRSEDWRNAIEGYLNTQRFDLLVEPEVFPEALGIYEREKWKYKLEGVGLVDTEKERRFLGTAEQDSLAAEVQAGHPVIRAHLEHLLGRVMKAENEQELRKHRTAVTRSCMVYHNYVARQMQKKQYEIPYMGAKAIIRQLEIRRAELESLKAQRSAWLRLAEEYGYWSQQLKEKGAQYGRFAANLGLMRSRLEAAEQLEQAQSDWRSLDLSESDRLKAEYDMWRRTENEWLAKLGALQVNLGSLETEYKEAAAKLYLHANLLREAEEECGRWVAEWGPDAETRGKLRLEEAEKSSASTWQKLQNWTGSWKGQQTQRDDQFRQVVKLRTRYNVDYACNADVQDADNTVYDQWYETIEHLNIPDYQLKVEAARKDSEEEFKSHFIFKLREAIEMARREFQQLNHALKNFPFSDDKYHFEVAANDRYKKFYDAVMDPMLLERGSIFDLPENDRTADLHELFEKLVRGEAGDMDEFTDYRKYLDFDIMVTSGNGARYRFSQVLKEKSGGETQTPFYIAILASFHHLYSGKSSRLVVFDEAFNKMDEQRIQSSLRLIKQMGLQLIAAVPDEKMQHMAPEVSTTLFVSKYNYQCYVDMIDKWDEDSSEPVPDDSGEDQPVQRDEDEDEEQGQGLLF